MALEYVNFDGFDAIPPKDIPAFWEAHTDPKWIGKGGEMDHAGDALPYYTAAPFQKAAHEHAKAGGLFMVGAQPVGGFVVTTIIRFTIKRGRPAGYTDAAWLALGFQADLPSAETDVRVAWLRAYLRG